MSRSNFKMSHNRQKKIAVINDFCGFGRCSIAVSLPIISALKIQCCPLPTSVFSNHTGYESFYCTDYTGHMEAYFNEWKKLDLRFEGILTGYLASPEQLGIVRRFLDEFKGPDTVTVIDPVMGDNGKLYQSYSKALADQMVTLVPYADILTPNLTEACILTGTEYSQDLGEMELTEMCGKLCEMGTKAVVVSGIQRGEDLENFVYEQGKEPQTVRVHKVGSGRAGTGDVFSSVIAADAVNGVDIADAVRHASSFIAKVLRRTEEMALPAADGVCFEEFLSEIGMGDN